MKRVVKTISIVFVLTFILSIFNIERSFAATRVLKITNATINSRSSEVGGDVLSFDDNTFTSNVIYHRLNDYAEYKVTIKNTDSKKHIIDIVVDDNNKEYFEYEYNDYKNTILNAGESIDIYIKEIYRNPINSISNRNISNNVKFTFNMIDDEQKESIIDIIINPKTGDNISIYVISAIVSLILILLLSLITIKWNSKSKRIIIAIIAVLALSTPALAKAIESEDSIVLNNSINILDNLVVTFKNNGETSQEIIKYGKKVKEPTSPEKEGYTFLGWYNGDTKYDFERSVTEDLSLVAKYSKNVYSITYSLNGGTAKNPSTIKVTELPLKLKNAKKLGYTFLGWTGSNGENPEKDLVISEVSENLSYTANFETEKYKINYIGLTKKELQNLNNPTEYTIESNITLAEPSDRLDSQGEVATKFIGWRDSTGNISKHITLSNTTGDRTYEAIWQKIKADSHTITYTLNGGSVDGENPTEFTSSTATFTLINPTKLGYEFQGWIGSNGNTPEKTITIEKGTTEDLEYEAVFTIINYEIEYDLNDGIVTNPTTYTVNDTITLNEPTKAGYTFNGWTGTDLSEPTKNVTIPVGSTGKRTYTANFTINNYEITYTLHGSDVTGNPDHYTIEDTFELNKPTKTGYEFQGWIGSNGDTPEKTVIITNTTGNKNYEAIFETNTYTVNFDKNDSSATGTMNPQQFEYDETKKLTANAFTKTGYHFVKWTTNADGSGTAYTDEEEITNILTTGSITLYANWKKTTTATFDTGKKVNIKMKSLSGQSSPRETDSNSIIKHVKYFEGTVDPSNRQDINIISTSNSEEKIYMWWDNNTKTIYYGSDADIIYTNQDASYMFNSLLVCEDIENHFRTDNTTTMQQMYYAAHALTVNDVSHFNTSKVTKMISTFGENYLMTSYNVKGWDVSKVTEFNFMFNQNTELLELDLTGWNTSSATNMRNMFSSMYKLKTLKIGTFTTSSVKNMQSMFDNEKAIEKLDLSHFDTSQVTNMTKMFYNMFELTELKIPFNTSNVTTMENMFIDTRKIEVLDLSTFNTAKVNNFKNMFSRMSALKTVYVSDSFVTTGTTSNPVVFESDTNLVGGANTTFSSDKLSYAHIDGGTSNPGYFTRKTN